MCVISLMDIPLLNGEEVSHPFIIARKDITFKLTYIPDFDQLEKSLSEKNWEEELERDILKEK